MVLWQLSFMYKAQQGHEARAEFGAPLTGVLKKSKAKLLLSTPLVTGDAHLSGRSRMYPSCDGQTRLAVPRHCASCKACLRTSTLNVILMQRSRWANIISGISLLTLPLRCNYGREGANREFRRKMREVLLFIPAALQTAYQGLNIAVRFILSQFRCVVDAWSHMHGVLRCRPT